jgi:hypothetical protein
LKASHEKIQRNQRALQAHIKTKTGQEKKTLWKTIGNLFEDGEYLKIKIDVNSI